MAVCPETSVLYEESIKTFTLRNADGITIPKSVREEAYTLAVDIIIVSVPLEGYKNYSTTPAESFYGNATLVLQDCLEKKIPISMPRQRIYYGRVSEAFVMWHNLVAFDYLRAYFLALSEEIVSLGAALGASVSPPSSCCSYPDVSWVELPLREVYFKPPNGTQYKIEVSWWKALQIQDGCGRIRNPKSKQTDGDKDSGLPPNGVQPHTAGNPLSPFAGLPPVTSDFEQGSFSNSKGESQINNPSLLDNVDSNNIPAPVIPADWGYFIKSTNYVTAPDTNCVPWVYVSFWLVNSSVTGASGVPTRQDVRCGVAGSEGNFVASDGTSLYFTYWNSVSFELVRSPSLPSNYNHAV